MNPAPVFTPLSVGRPGDLLLVNKIQQKGWDVTSKMRLLKTVASVVDSLLFTPFVGSQLACELPSGETHMARNLGGPFANSPWGTGPLPSSPGGPRVLPTPMCMSLEVGPPPVDPFGPSRWPGATS